MNQSILSRAACLGALCALLVGGAAAAQEAEPAPEPGVTQGQAECFSKCAPAFQKCQEKCGRRGKCMAKCGKAMQKCAEKCGIDTTPEED